MNRFELSQSKSKGKKINQVSAKQVVLNKSLSGVKESVLKDGMTFDGYVRCAGCARTDKKVDRSHTLSVAQRPDLQTDPRNIELLCRECHVKWESGSVTKMSSLLNFHKMVRYIFDMDTARFNKILFKAEDEGRENQRVSYVHSLLNNIEDWFCNNFENGKDRCSRQCGKCKNI